MFPARLVPPLQAVPVKVLTWKVCFKLRAAQTTSPLTRWAHEGSPRAAAVPMLTNPLQAAHTEDDTSREIANTMPLMDRVRFIKLLFVMESDRKEVDTPSAENCTPS